MKIYLAGKIAPDDWRSAILGYRGGSHPDNDHWKTWPVLQGAVMGHDYTGPFFISCDHGCYHGDGEHGAGVVPKLPPHGCGCHSAGCHSCVDCIQDEQTDVSREEITALCLDAIDRSNLVFAWLPTADAHGTLFELGYARARGKITAVGVLDSTPPRDAWFACHAVNFTVGASDPSAALRVALREAATLLGDITPPSYGRVVKVRR